MRRLKRIGALPLAVGMLALSGCTFAALAMADGISNTLDSTLDATAETMTLTPGGPKGATTLYLDPNVPDGKEGCNLQGNDERLVASVQSDNPSVATVSPSRVTFNSCGDRLGLTVTPVSEGQATISLTEVENNTGAGFDLAPAKFVVKVGSAPPPPPPPLDLPAPVAGKLIVAQTVSGKAAFKCKGGKRLGLKEAVELPVGCLIDARKGKVKVTAAANESSTKTKAAVFYQGQFKVKEKRTKRPVTELRLAGKLVGCSHASHVSATDKPAQESRRRRRRGRRLWGRGRGRFRTRGRRSSASVRGTTWLVEDRCDGSTLTKVRKGKVRVRDFVKHKTVTVKRGHSYVAKPKKKRR